jgi:hypothetical protein
MSMARSSVLSGSFKQLLTKEMLYQRGESIYDLDGSSDVGIVQPIIPFDLPGAR